MLLEFYKLFTKRRQINHNIVSFRTKLPNGGLEKKSVVAGVLWNGKMGVNPIKNMNIVQFRDKSNNPFPIISIKPTKPPNASSSSKQAFDLRKKLVKVIEQSSLQSNQKASAMSSLKDELLNDYTLEDWKAYERKENLPKLLQKIFNEAAGLQEPTSMRKTEGEGETLLNHGVQKLRISVPWKQNGKEEEFWEVDEGKEPFVLELLSITEALLQVPLTSDAIQEDQKTGLLVIKLKNWLQLNEESSPDLYLRKCQMELWNLVIECLEKDFKNARVVGSPGIGKSRSLTYLLMCLLKRRKKIVYEARKDNEVYVFWPTGESDYHGLLNIR